MQVGPGPEPTSDEFGITYPIAPPDIGEALEGFKAGHTSMGKLFPGELATPHAPHLAEEVLDKRSLVSARESRNQALGSTTQAPVKIWAAHHVSNQINPPWRAGGHALMTDATRQLQPRANKTPLDLH